MPKIQAYLVKRTHGVWYLYYTDAEGKYKGRSLKTKNEREARSKRRQCIAQLERDMYNCAEMERIAYLEKYYAEDIAAYEKDPSRFQPEEVSFEQLRIMELEAEIRKIKGIQPREKPISFTLDENEAAEDGPDIVNPGVEEFWERFFAWAKENRRPNTLVHYQTAWRKLLRYIKPKTVLDITPEKILSMMLALKKTKVKDKTINYNLCAIQTIFQTSIQEGFFTGTNPADGIRKKIKLDIETTKKAKALSVDQLSQLIEIAKKTTRDMYLAIAIGGYSGLRKGEIANLRWEDIDFENDTVSITRKERNNKKGIVGWVAKTKAGYRTLPLFPELKEILLSYGKESGYVIEAKNMQRSKWALPKEFDQIRKEFKVPWFTFHVLRHTFASLLLNQGLEVHIVAKILGHESMAVTEKIYFHFIPLTRKISLKNVGQG